MPPRTPKACRKRGCRNTTTDRSGYCDEHKGDGWQQYKPGQTRHQRGYGTAWDRRRIRILKRDGGLCCEHRRQGWLSRLATLTTSFLNLRAARMMMRTCKVSAPPATGRRQPAKDATGGGVKSLQPLPSRTARLIKFLRAQNKKLFSGRFCLLIKGILWGVVRSSGGGRKRILPVGQKSKLTRIAPPDELMGMSRSVSGKHRAKF